MTLTGRAAELVLDLAVALRRLPATSAALAAGDIDLSRVKVIADEVTGLTGEHVTAVDRAIAGAAPGQTTGQLRAATRRAVLAADPDAARKRKEQALREARVERWDEHSGTAALAGRDLPAAAVLAADTNLTALARQLKTAGVTGTMDTLRATIYLALLTGTPMNALLPTSPRGEACGSAVAGDDPGGAAGGSPGAVAAPDGSPAFGSLASFGATGSVNLTLPLATWLGLADTPGNAAGYGPLDTADSHALAEALAARANTRWCLTITGADGRPVAHGCARAGPPPGGHRARAAARPPHRSAAEASDRSAASSRDGPGDGSREGSGTGARAGPRIGARDGKWTFTITLLDRGECDHAWGTGAYEPSSRLRHLVGIRHATCTFPGCRRPATQCDADHTLAYDQGGRTCLCNLAPLCRRHHQAKQAPGWQLDQPQPGTMTWTAPSGRTYTSRPSTYPE